MCRHDWDVSITLFLGQQMQTSENRQRIHTVRLWCFWHLNDQRSLANWKTVVKCVVPSKEMSCFLCLVWVACQRVVSIHVHVQLEIKDLLTAAYCTVISTIVWDLLLQRLYSELRIPWGRDGWCSMAPIVIGGACMCMCCATPFLSNELISQANQAVREM